MVISRDVIFKENKIWDWTEGVTNVLLKWGRWWECVTEEEFEENEDNIEKQEQNETTGVISPSSLSSSLTNSVENNKPN